MNHEKTVFRSLEIIENRISEKLTVENIANSVYFSKYYYQRLFREVVGDSVMEYVTKRKLTLAGLELLETNATILDVALKFGYDSHEGFIRSFKAYMGVTPTEYRKYGLATISQTTVKERFIMTISKTTDEIVRELNGFIAKAKETAEYARKSTIPEYIPFWNIIADNTDAFADELKSVLERITTIAEHPDEITTRFAIIKVIEDSAFKSNLLAFNVNLMVSRGHPDHIRVQPLCERYVELAQASRLKSEKTVQFFKELSVLIMEDMRKTAIDKIQLIIQKGKDAIENIIGYSYIKDEIMAIVNELSLVSLEDITVSRLEDLLFRLNIASFAADTDIFRNPSDKTMFDGLTTFKESISESIDFFQTLVRLESNPVIERTNRNYLTDIAFQGKILLFYTRGEVSDEKLGKLLSVEQKATFNTICTKINDSIQFTLSSSEESAYKKIADQLNEIHSDMTTEADKLNECGGVIRFLADEIKHLSDSVMKYSNDINE